MPLDLGRELINTLLAGLPTSAMPSTAAKTPQYSETTRCANSGHSRMQSGLTGFGRQQIVCFSVADSNNQPFI
jgi:hypothetical protein